MSKIVTANLALYILISLLLFSFSVQDVSAQCMVGGMFIIKEVQLSRVQPFAYSPGKTAS